MYNRWTPQEYQSGGELYHYGVKGMKWKNKKDVQEQAQPGITGMGAGAISNWDSVSGLKNATTTMSLNTKMRLANEQRRPEWQKKWDRSSAKKTLKSIMSKVKSRMPKKAKKKKRKITVY